jgi:putative SOS response-associated peptidase YedK
MCGRFFVVGESENELLGRMIEEASRRQRALTGESTVAVGEVFPSAAVAAMALGRSGEIGVFPMIWGFHRPDGKGLIINARSETAPDKPMFRKSVQ